MAHKPERQLVAEIEETAKKIEVGAKYAHYKNPDNTYDVLGFSIIEATDEIGVRYKANYGKRLEFVRAVSVWLEDVEWQGQIKPRFSKVT